MDVKISQVTERDRGVKVFAFEVHQGRLGADTDDAPILKQLAKAMSRWRDRQQCTRSSLLPASLE